MAIQGYIKNYDSPVFGRLRENWQAVNGLVVSPRVNGRLVIRENPLGSIQRRSGSYDPYTTRNRFGSVIRQSSTYDGLKRICEYRGLHVGQGWDENVRLDAISDAYSKLNEKIANVADIIRTRKETINMVTNAIIDLTKAYRAIRRGKIRRASSILGTNLHPKPKGADGASRWLEYSYGWSPLVQDVYNILDKGFGELLLSVNGRSKNQTTLSTEFVRVQDSGYHTGTGLLIRVNRATCTVKVNFPGTAFPAISAWGLDNPGLLLWEAMPYSFVIDWFYPVGDYLDQACNVLANAKIKEMSVTTRLVNSLSASARIDEGPLEPATRAALSIIQDTKRRSNGIVPRPLPRLQNPFTSTARLMNQLALAKLEFSNRVINT